MDDSVPGQLPARLVWLSWHALTILRRPTCRISMSA